MTVNNKLRVVEPRDEWMSKGKGGEDFGFKCVRECCGGRLRVQIALTHPDNPAVFGILRAAKVKVLQAADPHLGRAAALGEKGFASMFLGHQGC